MHMPKTFEHWETHNLACGFQLPHSSSVLLHNPAHCDPGWNLAPGMPCPSIKSSEVLSPCSYFSSSHEKPRLRQSAMTWNPEFQTLLPTYSSFSIANGSEGWTWQRRSATLGWEIKSQLNSSLGWLGQRPFSCWWRRFHDWDSHQESSQFRGEWAGIKLVHVKVAYYWLGFGSEKMVPGIAATSSCACVYVCVWCFSPTKCSPSHCLTWSRAPQPLDLT